MIELIADYKFLWLVLHVASMGVGLGAVTVTDYFFFQFLKDFRISHQESAVLAKISDLIWAALSVSIVSGFLLYLPNAAILNGAPKFQVKVLVVAVIIINGYFLGKWITPRLKKITFHKRHKHHKGELLKLRKIAFASGAISITSWYSAFLLGMTPRTLELDFAQIFLFYLLVLAVAIGGSQLLERYYHYKGSKQK